MRSTRLRTALLASGAAVALAATSGPAAADDLQSLRDQLQKLQSKVAKIEADRSQKTRKAAAAAAVESGDKPKSWKLPGTNTSMIIGGYVKLDFIYDFYAIGNRNKFATATIAVPDDEQPRADFDRPVEADPLEQLAEARYEAQTEVAHREHQPRQRRQLRLERQLRPGRLHARGQLPRLRLADLR